MNQKINTPFLFCPQNTNDHSPLFPKPLYQVDIFENITTGAAVLHVPAQDRDIDVLMGLRYSIVSGNSLERFFIDAFSGVIYVKSPIDRDPPRSETSFLLTVITLNLNHKEQLNRQFCLTKDKPFSWLFEWLYMTV